ncbi:MAG: lipoyl(octanoyl) transferase LipB [Myxococcota bacterium]|nr:lipoyl(octanoyl) transferase LipB [Myxococcota bacterium]
MGLERAWWGQDLPYGPTLERQEKRRSLRQEGGCEDLLAGLVHRSVITTGKRSVQQLPSEDWLRRNDTELHATNRGGLATWHGPGQLVGYLIADLRGWGVRRTVNALEQGLIDWLAGRGVVAGRREGFPGVWVAGGKIAAIGLNVQKGVSVHGFALNLRVQTSAWDAIVPCGIQDAGPISLHELQEGAPGPVQAWPAIAEVIHSRLSSLDAVCGGR